MVRAVHSRRGKKWECAGNGRTGGGGLQREQLGGREEGEANGGDDEILPALDMTRRRRDTIGYVVGEPGGSLVKPGMSWHGDGGGGVRRPARRSPW